MKLSYKQKKAVLDTCYPGKIEQILIETWSTGTYTLIHGRAWEFVLKHYNPRRREWTYSPLDKYVTDVIKTMWKQHELDNRDTATIELPSDAFFENF